MTRTNLRFRFVPNRPLPEFIDSPARHRLRLCGEMLEPRLCLSHWGSPAVPPLSSLPGADHTVYLDFNGAVVENTSWNSYYNQTSLDAPPYDIDGNPGAFSATELARIEEAWQRVAEDFIPFAINVTTVDPGVEALRKSGSGDAQWGIRVLMTDEADMVSDPAERCGCGGIAYINSFDWSSDTPVWVFTTGGKSVAEAASHEVGHSLGLSHDGLESGTTYYAGHGSGETGWAPIMGVGYNRNVTQWDRGEYFASNNDGSGANYNAGPDDLAIITTGHGFSYRSDDHGDQAATASPMIQVGTSVSGAGIVETTTDVDVWSFTTGAGSVSLEVSPFTPGPNLDVRLDLYDAAGTLVTSADPPDTLSATITTSLAAGQYFLHVDGTGVGDPGNSTPSGYSDYASMGRYDITGTVVDAGVLPQLAISDATLDEADGAATFTVTVSGNVTEAITVDYATADGSATSGNDYAAAAGTLTFLPGGSTSQTLVIAVTDDALTEGSENFFVQLSNATAATIADGQGMATITDNDTDIMITDVSANEGNLAKGKKNAGDPTLKDFVFTVSLSSAVGHTVSVAYATQDGSATTADSDYQATSGVVTFAPGETSKSITVVVLGDNTAETDEDFAVELSNPSGGNLVVSAGTGTIIDDDSDGGGNGGGGNGGGRQRRGAVATVVARADRRKPIPAHR